MPPTEAVVAVSLNDFVVSPRVAYRLSLLLALTALLAFVFVLNRYPEPYFDDAFFNYPAVRLLDGNTFEWSVAPDAPFSTTVWAYHAPLFPRLQILTFKLLGISAFSCRAPQFVAGVCGVFLLSIFAIRCGYPVTGVSLGILWLGDRAYLEILYGRMEGLALVSLVAGFICFTISLRRSSKAANALTGLCLATAIAFHPVTALFWVAVFIVFASRPEGRFSRLGAFITGSFPPVLLTLALVAPHFKEAYIQFSWNRGKASRGEAFEDVVNLLSTLRWSKYWFIALVLATMVAAVPTLLRVIRRRTCLAPVRIAACVFAAAGLGCVLTVSAYPYYLVYFSVWAVIAVLISIEDEHAGYRLRPATLVAGAVLLLSWLPGAAWNALRWRESVLTYKASDPNSFRNTIGKYVPARSSFQITPELFLFARGLAGAQVNSPYARAEQLSDGAFLVLTENDMRRLGGRTAPGLDARKLIYSGPLFPDAPARGGTFFILGPQIRGELPRRQK